MAQSSPDSSSAHPAVSNPSSSQELGHSIQDNDEFPIAADEIDDDQDGEAIEATGSSRSPFWKGMVAKATQTAQTVSGAAQGIVQTTAEATVQTTQKLSEAAQGVVQSTTETAAATVDSVTQTGKAIAQATTETGTTVVTSIGSGAASIGSSIGQGISTGTSQAGQMVVNTVSQATSRAGKAVEWVNERSHFQHLTRAIKVDWLVGIIDNVNVAAVETRIQDLKQKHPTAIPYQLAGRIMAKKSLIVGGSGLASSMLPGAAAAMVAFDLAATTAIQAEMGYEIAAAYGLDVHDPARKGEILAIFGLALGSSQALKTGFNYLARNVPVAGAVVGASTNAVALYAVGHAACQFYETKLNEKPGHALEGNSPALLPESTVADEAIAAELDTIEVQQQTYFEEAIAQQILMDQVFAHILKAGHPDKTWPQLLPILEDLHFNPASIQLIAQYLDNPSDFDALIGQINPEFALPLVTQCQKLVDADGHQTPDEKRLLAKMTETLLPFDGLGLGESSNL